MNLKALMIRGRKIFGSVCLSAGVLAIANSETIWQEYHRGDLQESHELINASNNRFVAAKGNRKSICIGAGAVNLHNGSRIIGLKIVVVN